MTSPLVLAAALCGALVVDRLFGEPPARAHPVVWMGRYLRAIGPRITGRPPAAAFLGGTLAWCAGAAAVAGIAAGLQYLFSRLAPAGFAIGLAVLLKPLLAWRMLREEVVAVETALALSLDDGRARLARLVSRDVTVLDETAVRESAIETLAENLNDSVVSPLFWFAVGGLPAAALYRFANTADAMWGYRGRFEWAGKCAARADDVLSWLPARLTALLLCLAARRCVPLAAALQAARATPSPNGGWPMGVTALLLGVRLAKPGVYVLNEAGRACTPADARRAVAWCGQAVGWAAAIGVLALGLAARVR